MTSVTVVGSGAWGTATACAAARAGCRVTLVCRDTEQATELNTHRTNSRYLGDVTLHESFTATTDPAKALAETDIVILAIPAQSLGTALPRLAPHIPHSSVVLNTAKGLDSVSRRRLSEVIADHLPNTTLGVLSGPSFARDVARGLPTAVTLAMQRADLAIDVATQISSQTFRVYGSDDVLGVEIGGALKNVLALAAGMLEGKGLGDSAKAALITRGFVELLRIGRHLGAKDETLIGLSGFGDLQLTCSSLQSRNFGYGIALGRGEDVSGRPLAEGVATTEVAVDLAKRLGVDTPIIKAVESVLFGQVPLDAAIETLLSRPLKAETRAHRDELDHLEAPTS